MVLVRTMGNAVFFQLDKANEIKSSGEAVSACVHDSVILKITRVSFALFAPSTFS